jgi:uncharacterized protein (UPF0147 family)
MREDMREIVIQLHELKNDSETSKSLKEKIDKVISIIDANADLALEKALFALEELNSTDLPSYHRTQVWDVISLIESAKVNS